jgi:hypothetical protein
MKPVALTLAALLFYVGSYCVLAKPINDPFAGGIVPNYHPDPFTEKIGTQQLHYFDRAATVVFTPIHWVDRGLRTGVWK